MTNHQTGIPAAQPEPTQHPSLYIESRCATLRQSFTLLRYALAGIVDLDDHAELSDEKARTALREELTNRFDAMIQQLDEIEACTDSLRATGVKPVIERIRDAVRAGTFPTSTTVAE